MKAFLVLSAALVLTGAALAPAMAQDAGLVFTALDANKDGKISKAEAQKNPAVAQMFDQADKNKDGFLSKEEFEAAFGKK
ncbi:MAG: EF-hand domain-containing protein [Alphaproteobacteria bacterium]|mgnify:CR=1 FL=1|nr:EF-hand domain-containing protein [Alphaproteobacteria bacterium]